MTSVYNKVKTAYAVVETAKLDEWKTFGHKALGLHMDERGPDLVSFRVDDRERRIIVRKSDREDYAGLGLEIADRAALDEILLRLKSHNVAVDEHSGPEADLRGVTRFWSFLGPKKQVIEMFLEARDTEAPLDMVTSGFHTGDSGLCHCAITSTRPQEMIAFWQEIFDVRTSDYIEEKISGINLLIAFMRFNERHHSIAVVRTKGLQMDPFKTRIQHMALEVNSIHDVIGAYERCREHGFKIAMSLGKHTNDGEISFYVVSPSGFEIEIGWEPVRITETTDWADGQVVQKISSWGHRPEAHTMMDEVRQVTTGFKSLFRKEYTPL